VTKIRGFTCLAAFVALALTGCAALPNHPSAQKRAFDAYRHCTHATAARYVNRPAWTAQAIANHAETVCRSQSEAYRKALFARYSRMTNQIMEASHWAIRNTMQMTIKVHARDVQFVKAARGRTA
jgi:hypothetical protein